jgi:hypothetical protein
MAKRKRTRKAPGKAWENGGNIFTEAAERTEKFFPRMARMIADKINELIRLGSCRRKQRWFSPQLARILADWASNGSGFSPFGICDHLRHLRLNFRDLH